MRQSGRFGKCWRGTGAGDAAEASAWVRFGQPCRSRERVALGLLSLAKALEFDSSTLCQRRAQLPREAGGVTGKPRLTVADGVEARGVEVGLGIVFGTALSGSSGKLL
jgi:hypothetical protein